MTDRTIIDAAGRTWTCVPTPADQVPGQGRDVTLSCRTESVAEPVQLTVGWRWETMSPNGLGRLISQASPAPRA